MDNETLDRMIEVFEDQAIGLSLGLSGKDYAREAMLAALRAMWRPIEEAPEDGTWLILMALDLSCDANNYVDVGRFDCSGWYTADNAPLDPLYFAPLLPWPQDER